MRIGFIGLGTMGGSIALNVLKAGYELTVFDLRREAVNPHIAGGASWASSIRELGANSDVVLSSLPGPPEMEAVANELYESMHPGSIWFDLSTNSPTVVRAVAAHFSTKKITLMDAPVSGGPHGAKSGKLAIWVGGPREVYDANIKLLNSMGDEVLYVGDIGAGSIAKLVHNCAGYMVQTALAEAFCLGVKAGLGPLELWSAVRQGGLGRRRTFDRLQKQFLQGVFDPPDFALKLAFKDVTLATNLARELGVPMRVADLTRTDMVEAINRGWEARDSRVPMLLQEERSGVHIQVSKEAIQEELKKTP